MARAYCLPRWINSSSRSRWICVRIDGATSVQTWLPHITAYVPALESVEQVNVVTNSFSAEQGLAGGAAVNVQIKSGTNDIHGSGFWYNVNNAMIAKPFTFALLQQWCCLMGPSGVARQFRSASDVTVSRLLHAVTRARRRILAAAGVCTPWGFFMQCHCF